MSIIKTLSVTPTISTSAYTAGYSLGALQTLSGVPFLSGGGNGYIVKVYMTDKSKQNAITDITFFNANPSGSTVTDHGALNIVAADLGKIIGYHTISNFDTYSATSVGYSTTDTIPFSLGVGTIYAVAKTQGTPTYAGASGLTFSYEIEQY